MKFTRTFLASFIAVFTLFYCVSALAQYVWLDAAGRKVFSDQPPPPNITAKRILQQPGKAPAPLPVANAEETAPADDQDKSKTAEVAAKTTPAPKIVSKDKDLEAAKKKIDDEAAAKKKAEDDVRNVAKADNCQRAKLAKMQFETGRPISTVNAKGERIIMDEAARMVETKRIEGILAADCR
jgi:type IV secretory pathway VirB10-like protein